MLENSQQQKSDSYLGRYIELSDKIDQFVQRIPTVAKSEAIQSWRELNQEIGAATILNELDQTLVSPGILAAKNCIVRALVAELAEGNHAEALKALEAAVCLADPSGNRAALLAWIEDAVPLRDQRLAFIPEALEEICYKQDRLNLTLPDSLADFEIPHQPTESWRITESEPTRKTAPPLPPFFRVEEIEEDFRNLLTQINAGAPYPQLDKLFNQTNNKLTANDKYPELFEVEDLALLGAKINYIAGLIGAQSAKIPSAVVSEIFLQAKEMAIAANREPDLDRWVSKISSQYPTVQSLLLPPAA